jgi:hypothetical protein
MIEYAGLGVVRAMPGRIKNYADYVTFPTR